MGVFVVAPASSFHHHHGHDSSSAAAALISASDAHNAAAASNAATALGVGVGLGVIPVLSADDDRFRGGGIQFWQQQQQQQQIQSHHHNSTNYMKSKSGGCYDSGNPGNLLQAVGGSGGIGDPTNSSTATCHDCGNQAKKDCPHRRCRTCCKSRGFDCSTHVKSTWVPAARRRERQMMTSSAAPGAGGGGSSGATSSGTKKPRLIASQTTTTTASHTSTSNTTPPRSFETSSSHQDAGFRDGLPGQVRAPAVFKCVRVTAMDDGEDQFAYQAVVKIQGRVFKGFLYDQGAETRDVFPNISELHLGGGGGGSSGGGRNGGSSPTPILDPSDVYAASGGGFLGGSGYGNQIN